MSHNPAFSTALVILAPFIAIASATTAIVGIAGFTANKLGYENNLFSDFLFGMLKITAEAIDPKIKYSQEFIEQRKTDAAHSLNGTELLKLINIYDKGDADKFVALTEKPALNTLSYSISVDNASKLYDQDYDHHSFNEYVETHQQDFLVGAIGLALGIASILTGNH